MRSSETLYRRFLTIKWIKRYLSEYKKNNGMTKKAKISVILLMWAMIAVSCVFFIHSEAFKIIVVLLGLTGTYVMGIVVPTATLMNNNQ